MAKKRQRKNPFLGRWRITWMEAWDQDYVDAEEEGYFEFKLGRTGWFHFGYVSGEIDHHLSTRDDKPCLDSTWEGNDEMDPAHGGGWVVVEKEQLQGRLLAT